MVDNEIRATEEMCIYCFDVLAGHFEERIPPIPSFVNGIERPLFVTWETYENGEWELRGCIGCLSPRPLSDLQEYTYSSAFRDRRFHPIANHELQNLRCSVSLLVNYELATNCFDWEIGVHGIIIEFRDQSGKKFNATYLPEVAAEQVLFIAFLDH